MPIMIQTRIDQFYKATNSNNSSLRKKNNLKKLTNCKNSTAYNKKENVSLKKPKVDFIYKHGKSISYKVNEKQQVTQYDNSLKIEISQSAIKVDVEDRPIKEDMITDSSRIKHTFSQKKHQENSAKYSQKVSSPKNVLNTARNYSLRRKLFKDEMDELLSRTIDNFNSIKEGSIINNNIDLNKVYSSKVFNYMYTSSINTRLSTRFEINDVVVPTEIYSRHLFLVIVTVFSNPINCGYFDEDEIELIFSIFTLSRNAQALLIRMLKRKQSWHRINSIKYDEISNNLKPVFEELVSRSIFTSNIENEETSLLLNLLQVNEIRKLCQALKIGNTGKKEHYVQSLLKFCNTKPLFPGMESPATKLHTLINGILGYCILLNTKIKQIIDRIITLFIPTRDSVETLADTFLMLLNVQTNQIIFPVMPKSNFPIFASKAHLLNYVEARNTLSCMLNAIEKKHWQNVRELGIIASQHLLVLLDVETQSLENSTLPHHIRRFMPCYTWLKVLSKSIDSFKKTKETMPQAIEFLNILIDQKCHMQNKKGQWYNELIKIEMHHRKNLAISVALVSKAVLYKNMTKVDRLNLLDRVEMLIKRKSGISKHIKEEMKIISKNKLSNTRLTTVTNSITITGRLCRDTSQGKSTWCISSDAYEQVYGSVESLALYYYKCEGYPKGIHCEGALPITLFGIFFWDEIYNIDIPGACVSSYQDSPMDLYSPEFYKNRKKEIDEKLQIIRKFDSKELKRYAESKFTVVHEYTSISQDNIFDDSNSFQEIVNCLGVKGVVGICKRLIRNFPLWRAGFPDLIVWNACTNQYKIVEVKGPGDSLSTKQRLWLEYLNKLGLSTEICYCKSNTGNNNGQKRKHEAMI